jgi:DNA-binding CsgD family transcriptional regulator
MRLAQGQVDVAAASIRRVIDNAVRGPSRSRLLAGYVEIMLVAGDVPAARAAVEELQAVAEAIGGPWLQAVALHATGAVLRAEGDGPAALSTLRRAWTAWQAVDAPYEAARARVTMGLACRDLADEDGAQMEFDAARWVFQRLGAGPELARVDSLARNTTGSTVGVLTAREVQVLRLVAAGKTNRDIAAELFLSEKTVARHLSNIFAKLGLRSRSAATAYAYENGLV